VFDATDFNAIVEQRQTGRADFPREGPRRRSSRAAGVQAEKNRDYPLLTEGVFRNMDYSRLKAVPVVFCPERKDDSGNGCSMSIQRDRRVREQVIMRRWSSRSARSRCMRASFFGLSSYGYDLRVSGELKVFTVARSAIIDSRAFDERLFVSFNPDSSIVPPS